MVSRDLAQYAVLLDDIQ